jgi:hypothetical protein
MSYFDKWLKSDSASSAEVPSEEARHVVGETSAQATTSNTPITASVVEAQNITCLESSCAVLAVPEASITDAGNEALPGAAEGFTRTSEKVNLWETKIQKTVPPSKLVWAPFFRFRNQYFCARLCDNTEAESAMHIPAPILPTECVVEFIYAPKTRALDTQLLKVLKSKVIPYYGKGERDALTAEELQTWEAGLLNKMRKVSHTLWYLGVDRS